MSPSCFYQPASLCPLFPELKAQASLLPELFGFCNLRLEFRAINPSADDFLMNAEELWAVHPSPLTLLTRGRFSPHKSSTFTFSNQRVTGPSSTKGFDRGRNIFRQSFGMSQVLLHKCRMLQFLHNVGCTNVGADLTPKIPLTDAGGLVELVVKHHQFSK